ncbi:MAG: hypothetical protein IJ576_08030, partial [Synergistaceae bacterium]|nr:hypothetical protein [Synergistaceae bacterium]
NELNVSGCENLTDLNCENNNLNNLDVSGCPQLVNLTCDANNLGELNVEGCENLEHLSCSANALGTLDLISCRKLERLYCYSNNLTEIKLGTTRLSIMVCDDNSLSELNIEENKQLKRLDCQNNAMPKLDITSSTFANLERLKCYAQSLSGLIVSSFGGGYQFDLNFYISSSESAAAVFKAAGAESSALSNISGVKAYDANGNEIEITSSSDGVLTFASKPQKIVYNYDTGYNGTKMDVTISDKTAKRSTGESSETEAEAEDSGSNSKSGGGSGGCNAGFNLFAALLFLALAEFKTRVKYY